MSIVKNWWMKNDGTTGKKHSSKDIQPIGAFLQQKFSRGVDYNLKIVIRGDRSVGKSTLLSRLKGEQFKEEYIPSNEIQLANIHWDHKNSQSVIKVEVWDVVDKGKPRNTPKGLKVFRKLTNNPPDVTIAGETTKIEPCLDASFINVYKGAHGVILMMDMTKPRTFDYVRRELVQIPSKLPTSSLLLNSPPSAGINCSINPVTGAIGDVKGTNSLSNIHSPSSLTDSTRPTIPVQYCESSMKTGLGLMYVYKFLNLPFLCLQRDVLHHQLRRNHSEMMTVLYELSPKGNETQEQPFSYADSSETKTTGCPTSSTISTITSNYSSSAIIDNVGSSSTHAVTKTVKAKDSLKLSNMNHQNTSMEINVDLIKPNASNEFEQNPMVIAFSEEVDPADTEIYYCNDSESSFASYTCIPNGLADTDCSHKELPHGITHKIQTNLHLEQQTNSHQPDDQLEIESTKDLSTSPVTEQSRKTEFGQNFTDTKGTCTATSANNDLLALNENIIILPTDSDALERFLEDS
ncbi:unnamed protein product [Heterobilharzia americana]|nr:unnamed protein product [Heterobilharzia americana]